MPLIRSIGRWSLVALVINCIIGSGIFGVPGTLIAAVGRASPIAMILAGLLTSVIVLCFAEVGSRFSEPGGVYLYSRSAFGRLAGLEVGWFYFLSAVGGAAANASLFVIYLSGMAPWCSHGWPRPLVVAALIVLPAAANYIGTRKGTIWCNVFTVAKLAPLALLIGLGLIRFAGHAEMAPASEVVAPGWAAWGNALLLLIFVFGGFEDPMTPAGEVTDPRRTIPFALITGLAACTAIYALLQFVVVAMVGTGGGERPLASAADLLVGRGGALFVDIAAMISTYGWISASLLNVPRLLFSLADKGDFPPLFGKVHPRFNTPHAAILIFAALAWVLTVTGTFKWSLLVSAGAGVMYYLVICAALLRLRRLETKPAAFRLPFGAAFSIAGMGICVLLLSRLELREALLMMITAAVAGVNWWWVKRSAGSPLSSGPQRDRPLRDVERGL